MSYCVVSPTITFTKELVACIVAIRIKPGRFGDGHSWVQVERRDGLEGTKWAVCDAGLCFNHEEGEWEYERMPSSRDDEFLKNCRFDTFQEAVEAAIRTSEHIYHPIAPHAHQI